MSEETPYPPEEFLPEEWPEQPEDETIAPDDAPLSAEPDDDFRLLSTQDFEAALEALADYPDEPEEADAEIADETDAELPDTFSEELNAPDALAEESADEFPDAEADEVAEAFAAVDAAPPPTVDREERVRTPRARRFRRAVRNQIGMLPLALGLLASGAYLIARAQDVQGLPMLSDAALAGGGVLVLGFTAFFHALLFGRRERGLIFLGVWIWASAGTLAALVYGLDTAPDAVVWWPALLWSTALAFVATYLVERTHDARLLLLSMIALVAGTTAYMVTSGRIGTTTLDEAASYWPLLLTVIGVGVLPVAFRRRTE